MPPKRGRQTGRPKGTRTAPQKSDAYSVAIVNESHESVEETENQDNKVALSLAHLDTRK